MDLSGNWTSSGSLMFFSGYTDMRHSGSWSDSLSNTTANSTGFGFT